MGDQEMHAVQRCVQQILFNLIKDHSQNHKQVLQIRHKLRI